MADLTEPEVAYINLITGNDICFAKVVVDDTLMEWLFDQVFPTALDRNQAILRTAVHVLRAMVARAKTSVTSLPAGGARSSDTEVRRLERLRDYYERLAGMGGGLITTGILELNFTDPDAASEWEA